LVDEETDAGNKRFGWTATINSIEEITSLKKIITGSCFTRNLRASKLLYNKRSGVERARWLLRWVLFYSDAREAAPAWAYSEHRGYKLLFKASGYGWRWEKKERNRVRSAPLILWWSQHKLPCLLGNHLMKI